ncbi:MAG: GDP-mannose 4,6-dehydratase [Anaerolineae bacterium]|nr:GDP-mannose 4,6-dehydratase [Anaerolineae bacterium]
MGDCPAHALVTGGTGFVGHHLVSLLVDQGCRVSVTSIPGDPLLSRLPDGVDGYAFDIRDGEATQEVLARVRPDVVFHLAALVGGRDVAALLSVNVVGTDTLLTAARSLEPPPVVVIPGSAAEYGLPMGRQAFDEDAPLRPISAYGVSKAAQTLTGLSYALRGEVPVIVGRIFNMAGPGEPTSMLCGAIASQIAGLEARGEAGVLRVGNLSPYRDYLDVRDVVRALAALWRQGESGRVYNISSGVARQVESLVGALVDKARVPVEIQPDPARQRPSDIPYCSGDSRRLREETAWTPQYGLDATLSDTLTFWRAQVIPLPGKDLARDVGPAQ